MRVFITGGTGFLGNNVIRSLLQQGHQITAAIRHSSDPRPLSGLDIETVPVDLSQTADINLAVKEADWVIHAAGLIHIGRTKLEASRAINVESTRLIAEAARRHDTRMIHVSSVDTLAAMAGNQPVDETQLEPAKSNSNYIVTKREAEQIILGEVAQGLDGVIVNPGFMAGPWDWKPSSGKIMLALNKSPVLYFAPAGGGSVVDVRDVADGIVSACEHGRSGERYILGGENLSYLELWALMAKVMQRRPPVRVLPDWLATGVGRCGDLISRMIRRELDLNSIATEAGQVFHWYDSQKAKQELGYRIGNVEDALRDAWDWFKQYDYV